MNRSSPPLCKNFNPLSVSKLAWLHVATGQPRALLQSLGHPPCPSRPSAWYQCTAKTGQSPGAICLPLCVGDTQSGPCQPCSDAAQACNAVRVP